MGILRNGYRLCNKMYNKITLKRHGVSIESDYAINGRICVIAPPNRIVIGSKFHCNSGKYHTPIGGDTVARLVIKEEGNIVIGNNVGISNATIVSAKKIVIGNDVLIGGGCKIYDTDFHSIDYENRQSIPDMHIGKKDVYIGDGCFIGGHCIILKGTVIGKHSVIGAGSVVAGNIPEGEIWAGNPARFIRTIESNEIN